MSAVEITPQWFFLRCAAPKAKPNSGLCALSQLCE